MFWFQVVVASLPHISTIVRSWVPIPLSIWEKMKINGKEPQNYQCTKSSSSLLGGNGGASSIAQGTFPVWVWIDVKNKVAFLTSASASGFCRKYSGTERSIWKRIHLISIRISNGCTCWGSKRIYKLKILHTLSESYTRSMIANYISRVIL